MGQIHVERTIAASPERVFDWLLDPVNLTVSPLFRKAGWAKDSSGPDVGAVRELTGLASGLTNRSRPTTRPGATHISSSARSRLATRWRRAHVHSVGRRHACRLGERLHASGSRGRQGGRATHIAADLLAYLPRDPRGLRKSIRELVFSTQTLQVRRLCRPRRLPLTVIPACMPTFGCSADSLY